jgi:hypothetical protein
MFEWHGWATIVASPGVGDDAQAEARQRDAEQQVARAICEAGGISNETLDLRNANGLTHIWLAGAHNHRQDAVIEFFRQVVVTAPGSYGVMYALDHDLGGPWERWVMRRGTITLEIDGSLSPHIGQVEDPPDLDPRIPDPE